MLSPIDANAILCCNCLDVSLSHIGRINKQFVYGVFISRVLISECDKVSVTKELLRSLFLPLSLRLIWLTLFF